LKYFFISMYFNVLQINVIEKIKCLTNYCYNERNTIHRIQIEL
jgi:hypothetical protein